MEELKVALEAAQMTEANVRKQMEELEEENSALAARRISLEGPPAPLAHFISSSQCTLRRQAVAARC